MRFLLKSATKRREIPGVRVFCQQTRSNKSGRILSFRYTSRLAIILGQFAIRFSGKDRLSGQIDIRFFARRTIHRTRYQFSPFHYHFRHSRYQNREKKYTRQDKQSPRRGGAVKNVRFCCHLTAVLPQSDATLMDARFPSETVTAFLGDSDATRCQIPRILTARLRDEGIGLGKEQMISLFFSLSRPSKRDISHQVVSGSVWNHNFFKTHSALFCETLVFRPHLTPPNLYIFGMRDWLKKRTDDCSFPKPVPAHPREAYPVRWCLVGSGTILFAKHTPTCFVKLWFSDPT